MAKKKIKLEEVKPADVKGLLRDVPLENPVELTSVTRFSADHILRTSYNPTTKAVVLEDVPAGLKSEFTLGESGGGSVMLILDNDTGLNASWNDLKGYLDNDVNVLAKGSDGNGGIVVYQLSYLSPVPDEGLQYAAFFTTGKDEYAYAQLVADTADDNMEFE